MYSYSKKKRRKTESVKEKLENETCTKHILYTTIDLQQCEK